MAVFQLKKAGSGERMQKMARQAGKRLSARSSELGRMATAQSKRAAAGARSTAGKTRRYVRRHPLQFLGLLATVASLIGYMLFRRSSKR